MFGRFLRQPVPAARLRSASGPLLGLCSRGSLCLKHARSPVLQRSLSNLPSRLPSQLRKASSGIHRVCPRSLPRHRLRVNMYAFCHSASDLNSCYVPPLSFPLRADLTSTTSSVVCCIILITTCLIQERGKIN